MTIFRRQPSGGGLALPVTPDLTLDVEDLSLSDGESVTSWGDISTWELGNPTYNASENAVQFASGEGGGNLRSLFGFDDIPAVTLTMLGRVTASVGNSLFISADNDDVLSRALATLSTLYKIEGGGRISDSDSYSLVSGPVINGLGGNVISTWVFDFANDAIRLYINGAEFATGGFAATGGGNTDATVAKTAQIFGANRVDTTNLGFVGFVRLTHLYVGTALTRAQVEQEAAFILSEYDL